MILCPRRRELEFQDRRHQRPPCCESLRRITQSGHPADFAVSMCRTCCGQWSAARHAYSRPGIRRKSERRARRPLASRPERPVRFASASARDCTPRPDEAGRLAHSVRVLRPLTPVGSVASPLVLPYMTTVRPFLFPLMKICHLEGINAANASLTSRRPREASNLQPPPAEGGTTSWPN